MRGYCACGCGRRTKIATQTRTRYGQVKGEPLRFIHQHHQRWKESAEDRFWSHVERRGSDQCWSWLGPKNPDGRGKFQHQGRRYVAARFSYEVNVGPIPDGFHVHHRCRNGVCVNPNHLEAMDSDAHREHHRIRNELGQGKLTKQEAEEIRVVVDALCEKYGIGPSTLADIGYRKTWR